MKRDCAFYSNIFYIHLKAFEVYAPVAGRHFELQNSGQSDVASSDLSAGSAIVAHMTCLLLLSSVSYAAAGIYG